MLHTENGYFTIHDETLVAEQPEDIVNIELFLHQKLSLYKMMEIENTPEFDYIEEYNKYAVTSLTKYSGSIGILSDRPGSGKSLTVLALIASNPILERREVPDISTNCRFFTFKNRDYVKIDDYNSRIHVLANLIIIPDHLTTQWKNYVEKYTTLTYETLFDVKKYDENRLIDIYTNNSIVILSSNCYEKVHESFPKVLFNRIFIDEADTSKIKGVSKLERPVGIMNWLVTGSFQSVIGANNQRQLYKDYTKDFTGNADTTIFNTISVINDQDVVNKSIDLPKPIFENIIIEDPSIIEKIGDLLPQQARELINSGNIEGAIKFLEIDDESPTTIFDALSHNLQIRYNNLIAEYNYTRDKVYQSKKAQEELLSKLHIEIESIKSKMNDLRNRINTDTDCIICLNKFTNPTVVKCCSRTFCFGCITECLEQNDKCPNCRNPLNLKSLVVIGQSSNDKVTKPIVSDTVEEKKDKVDILIEIISSAPQGSKIIIFSKEYSFLHKMKEFNLSNFYKLGKNATSDVEQFKNNKHTSILYMNSRTFATGLNLEFATHIIKLDAVKKETHTQIDGRVLRPGLKHRPHIISILYENESDSW